MTTPEFSVLAPTRLISNNQLWRVLPAWPLARDLVRFKHAQLVMRVKFIRLEIGLEAQAEMLPLWLPIAFGAGIAAWFALPTRESWAWVLGAGGGLALLGLLLGLRHRTGLALFVGGVALTLGCAHIWHRAERMAGPSLSRPMIVDLRGTLISSEQQVAREKWRLIVAPDAGQGLPARVRISLPLEALDHLPEPGARVAVRARLTPPPAAALPGGYDFQRQAWFQGIGAVGKALGPVSITQDRQTPGLRDRLSVHIARHVPEAASGVAIALVTGDVGRISVDDQQAMRTSGLAHLLSVSGLHLSAVVGAVFFLTLRLLALSPALALRAPLLLVAAFAAACAGIGYTLLTGAQVPTVRSCIAAILVLIGLALGREALTLRLVAAGALVVMLIWPEAVIGPSFQLSFAAITAIVALHDSPLAAKWLAAREEGALARLARSIFGLLLTGLVVELALAPIALFHFHKAGIYGALTNLVAIPLTTFIIMPAEALALVLDGLGLGAPFWWIAAKAIAALLALAHKVATWPGASALLSDMSGAAFGVFLLGGLWVLLWRGSVRWQGIAPLVLAALITAFAPAPDLLVTGDGRHMAVRDAWGQWFILRPRAGGKAG
ncbi:MAG: ComEC/Rec2 family competence protein [Chakrabartia sp.]